MPGSTTLREGEQFSLSAALKTPTGHPLPAAAGPRTPQWSSSDEQVAVVMPDASGAMFAVVLAQEPGRAQIRCESPGQEGEPVVDVWDVEVLPRQTAGQLVLTAGRPEPAGGVQQRTDVAGAGAGGTVEERTRMASMRRGDESLDVAANTHRVRGTGRQTQEHLHQQAQRAEAAEEAAEEDGEQAGGGVSRRRRSRR